MRIKSIQEITPRTVYAIQTSTRTFIADGLAHHNCVSCNMFKHGAYTEYALFMINKYGIEYVKELDKKSKQTVKISTVEIKELIEKYKNLLQPQP